MKKISLILIGILLLSGCDAIIDRGLKQYDVVIEPKEISIPKGGSGEVTVEIKLLTGIAGSIGTTKVTLFKAPTGVSIKPEILEIGTGSKPKTITISVAETADAVEDALFSLEALREGLTQYGEIKLTITD